MSTYQHKLSRRGSVFPERCETKLGEGGGGPNGGGYNGFGCGWHTRSSDRAWGAGWCQNARTEPLGLGLYWEMLNKGKRGHRGSNRGGLEQV
jgi:hypothetical protein